MTLYMYLLDIQYYRYQSTFELIYNSIHSLDQMVFIAVSGWPILYKLLIYVSFTQIDKQLVLFKTSSPSRH